MLIKMHAGKFDIYYCYRLQAILIYNRQIIYFLMAKPGLFSVLAPPLLIVQQLSPHFQIFHLTVSLYVALYALVSRQIASHTTLLSLSFEITLAESLQHYIMCNILLLLQYLVAYPLLTYLKCVEL